MKLPKPSEIKAMQELVTKMIPKAQEMNAALEDLQEAHRLWREGWETGEVGDTNMTLDTAIRRVLDAQVKEMP